jgi:uncharacterized protein
MYISNRAQYYYACSLSFILVSGLSCMDTRLTPVFEGGLRRGQPCAPAQHTHNASRFRATALHDAAYKGEYEKAERLIAQDKSLVNSRDERGIMPLRYAVEQGHITLVSLLLEHNALINARANDDQTAVHRAIALGHEAIARLLIEKTSDVTMQRKNFLSEGNVQLLHPEQTPLHIAAACGYTDIARMLLERKASLEARDPQGMTPLHRAVAGDQPALVQMLLEHGADLEAHVERPTPTRRVTPARGPIRASGAGNPQARAHAETTLDLALREQALRSLRELVFYGAYCEITPACNTGELIDKAFGDMLEHAAVTGDRVFMYTALVLRAALSGDWGSFLFLVKYHDRYIDSTQNQEREALERALNLFYSRAQDVLDNNTAEKIHEIEALITADTISRERGLASLKIFIERQRLNDDRSEQLRALGLDYDSEACSRFLVYATVQRHEALVRMLGACFTNPADALARAYTILQRLEPWSAQAKLIKRIITHLEAQARFFFKIFKRQGSLPAELAHYIMLLRVGYRFAPQFLNLKSLQAAS